MVQATDQERRGTGDDPRYGPTAGQLKMMLDEIRTGIERLHGTSSVEERRRLKAAHALFLAGARERMRVLRAEVKYLDWLVAAFAPEQFRGAPGQQVIASIMQESDGRMWMKDLQGAVVQGLGMKRTSFWAVIRKFERDGIVEVHESPIVPGKPRPVPSWVEVLSMTGGGAAPPPVRERKRELSSNVHAVEERRARKRRKHLAEAV